jgi:hypothetical protein
MKSYIGVKFGRLTVTAEAGTRDPKHRYVAVKCECGTEKVVGLGALKRGLTLSCGCLQRIDMIGRRFGRLVVVLRSRERRNGKACWICRCDCGEEKSVRGELLRNGHTRSCGPVSEEQRRALIKNLEKAKAARSIPLESCLERGK